MSERVDPRALKTRERALGAARDAFLAEGFDALTHLELARRSGIGRKTLYRHWPTVEDLVHATLDSLNFPRPPHTGELRRDLTAHLLALREALTEGPLAFVIHALAERSTIDPTLRPVRRRLIEEGCAPIRTILRTAADSGRLPPDLDVEQAASELEGPIFYRALVHDEPIPAGSVERAIDSFLDEHRSHA
ncbi:MAG: TetR/AcrR family transcriptional regulator [Acidimicrobiales bacterium]